jgi:7-cyano-7-deazaguanine synthase in queuosine biosynthesis
MITIKVETPIYDHSSGLASVFLSVSKEEKATLNIDFKTLLPFANLVEDQVLDFFIITSAVYGIDRFVDRKINSVDGWSREFKVSFPVSNTNKWKGVNIKLQELLSFLTGDYWQVEFHMSKFIFPKENLDTRYSKTFSQVNLFSGGLDSLIGALDFLKSKPKENILFVSHYDSQMGGPKKDQKDLIEKLNILYPKQFVNLPSLKVALEESTEIRETTFRSRSILFLGIAVLVAKAKNVSKIKVPENGTVSLNYPLSASRRSSCSTRTTHPFVIEKTVSILSDIGVQIEIQNPYEFNTKGEMVRECKDSTNLLKLVEISNSCGKRGHRAHWEDGKKDSSHCGICMPCIYRQASLSTIKDKTTYGHSINTLAPFKTKKSQDVGACLDFLGTPLSKEEIKQELVINGIKDLKKLNKFADVVINTRLELKAWVKKVGNSDVKRKAGIKC